MMIVREYYVFMHEPVPLPTDGDAASTGDKRERADTHSIKCSAGYRAII